MNYEKQNIRMRASRMAQQVRVFSLKSEDLRSVSRTCTVEGENRFLPVVL